MAATEGEMLAERPSVYYARDGQLLIEHLVGVARLAEQFAAPFGLSNAAGSAAKLHDIGKFTKAFQDYLLSSVSGRQVTRGDVIHALQGAKFLASHSRDPMITDILANAIASHHGGLYDTLSDGIRMLDHKLQRRADELHYDEILDAYQPDISVNEIRNEIVQLCRVFNEHQFPPRFMLHLATKAIFSCLVDADRCDAAGLVPNHTFPDWDVWITQLEKYLAGFMGDGQLNRVRQKISADCQRAGTRAKGIYTLSVPTGSGKTMASLRFALHHARCNRLKRIIYVIPYLSILDQMAQVLEKIFDAACRNQILEHHSNLEISDDSTSPNDEYEQHKLLTARWENPVILTTMVQFLETIYSNRAASLRKFHNMADAVLVFDEVQALPIKCTYLFNDAINYLHYCGGSSVLLCTATQPQLDRVSRPIKYSPNHALVTLSDAERAVFKRVHIANQSLTPFSFVDIARLAGKEIKAGKSTLVILNTKQSATEVYRLCKTSISNCRTFLLTTNLCPAHRKHQLAQITNRAKDERILCVSTQLIEAGVDLSFDCVIRAAAGLDSVVQAAGRCNRNGENSTPQTVHVINAVEEKLTRLAEIADGKEVTQRITREAPGISLLQDEALEQFYRYYFFNQQDKMGFPSGPTGQNLYTLLNDNPLASHAYQDQNGGMPYQGLPAAFQSAAEQFAVVDQGQVGVVVQYGNSLHLIEAFEKEYDPLQKMRHLRNLQQFTVNIFPQTQKKLLDAGAICPIQETFYFLSKYWYDSEEYGLLDTPKPAIE